MALIRQLVAISGPDQGEVFTLQRRGNIIGRDAGAQIILSDPEVSRHHCKISVEAQRMEIEDLGSTNGTVVNGRAVEKAWLHTGDTIQLGDSLFELSTEDEASHAPGVLAGQVTDRIAGAGKAVFLGRLGWESRVLLLMVLLVTVAMLLTALPLISGLADFHQQESRRRAAVLVTALALANKEAVNSGEEMSLNISGVERSPGVLRALIYDARGRILAPVSLLHQRPTDEATRTALAAQELVIREKGEFELDLAIPIKAFRPGRGDPQKIGTARLIFSTTEASAMSGLLWWRLLASFLLILAAGFAVGLAIIGFTRRLLLNLRDQCEEAIKGSFGKVAPAMVSPALTALSASINRCLSKMAALKPSSEVTQKAEERSSFSREIHAPRSQKRGPDWKESEKLVLDDQNIVCHASDGLAQILGLSASQMRGKHLLHVIQDQELLTRCLGLMEQAAEDPGQWHFADGPTPAEGPSQLAALFNEGNYHIVFNTRRRDGGGPLERL